MTTTRLDGLLIFNTKGPYKISVDGTFEERNEVICHEMNNKSSCNTAADLEQLLLSAFKSASRGEDDNRTTKQIQKEEKEENVFYSNDTPSEKDIKERADQLAFMFKMQKEVKMSELTDLFDSIVAERLIHSQGDIVMYGNVWDTLGYKDRIDIMFRYIVFFVNPLQSLSLIVTTEEGK